MSLLFSPIQMRTSRLSAREDDHVHEVHVHVADRAMFSQTLLAQFQELGLECHPFKVGWYNDAVKDDRFHLPYAEETLAYVVISVPSWFEKTFVPFVARNYMDAERSGSITDPVDQCMRCILARLTGQISVPVVTIHDFELEMPSRRPKVLVQTAAHVSGAAFYYRPSTTDKHRLGVCIHPQYGGWFGIRAVIILPTVMAPELARKPALDVVPDPDARRHLLTEFNERWQEGRYRDVIPVRDRYSPMQMEYFRRKPKQRPEFIRDSILPKILRSEK